LAKPETSYQYANALQDPKFENMRDILFLSHAYPEDNEFTRWLSLQLAQNGYPVWCDLTNLLGGEVVWDDVEKIIRERAIKILFVHSRTSNSKDGTMREIHLAQSVSKKDGLENFIIPLRIDELSQDEVTIELTRIAPIEFYQAWSKGLAQLLKKLEDESLPKRANYNAEAVSSWWLGQYGTSFGIIEQSEELLSNWYPIAKLPETIYYHLLSRKTIGKIELSTALSYPAIEEGINLLTFAEAKDFDDQLGDLFIKQSVPMNVSRLFEEENNREFKKNLSHLLRMAWEQFMASRGLRLHSLANTSKCGYFISGKVEKDTLYFTGIDGNKAHRSIVGYKTVPTGIPKQTTKRYWHFGIQGKPSQYPVLAYVIKPHVIFSSDGKEIWENKKKLAVARRNQCANWWNDEWRDRITAVMTRLANENENIRVPLGSDVFANVQKTPMLFESPVSYRSTGEEQITRDEEEVLADYELEEDPD
jgi:hypothetical protein